MTQQHFCFVTIQYSQKTHMAVLKLGSEEQNTFQSQQPQNLSIYCRMLVAARQQLQFSQNRQTAQMILLITYSNYQSISLPVFRLWLKIFRLIKSQSSLTNIQLLFGNIESDPLPKLPQLTVISIREMSQFDGFLSMNTEYICQNLSCIFVEIQLSRSSLSSGQQNDEEWTRLLNQLIYASVVPGPFQFMNLGLAETELFGFYDTFLFDKSL